MPTRTTHQTTYKGSWWLICSPGRKHRLCLFWQSAVIPTPHSHSLFFTRVSAENFTICFSMQLDQAAWIAGSSQWCRQSYLHCKCPLIWALVCVGLYLLQCILMTLHLARSILTWLAPKTMSATDHTTTTCLRPGLISVLFLGSFAYQFPKNQRNKK